MPPSPGGGMTKVVKYKDKNKYVRPVTGTLLFYIFCRKATAFHYKIFPGIC